LNVLFPACMGWWGL